MSSHEEQVKAMTVRCATLSSNAFAGLAIAAGVQLGLFTALEKHSSDKAPVTSQQLADHADLRERYVREWLNAMVTSRLVECTADGQTYWLSDVAKEVTKHPQTFGMLSCMPMMAVVFDDIVKCFKKDGPRGTSYDQYADFHAWMAETAMGERSKDAFLGKTVKSVPGLVDDLERGVDVIDLGCGRANQIFWAAEIYTKSRFIGIDFIQEPIDWANKHRKLSNTEYHCMNAKALPADWSNRYDVVTMFDSLHDQGRPDLALIEVHRILKPGGRLVLVDIASHTNVVDNINDPKAVFCYVVSLFHCMPISLNEEDGLGLGTCYGREKAFDMLGVHFEGATIVNEDGHNMTIVCTKAK